MKRNRVRSTIGEEPAERRADDFRALAQGILQQVNREISRTDFLEELAKMLLDFSGCEAVELRVGRGDQCLRCEAVRRVTRSVVLQVTRRRTRNENVLLSCGRPDRGLDAICRTLLEKRFPASSPYLTEAGRFWTGDLLQVLPDLLALDGGKKRGATGAEPYSSVAILPLSSAGETMGLLQLRSREKDRFHETEVEC